MATKKGYMMTSTSLTEEGNNFKEVFLEKMQKQGIISEEQHDEMNKYCFVIAEKTFFGKIWDKILWKDDSDAVNIIVVKIIE